MMKSLVEILNEAYIKKSDVNSDEDKIRYDIQSKTKKMKRLAKSGKTEEAMKLEQEIALLKAKINDLENKPKEEFYTEDVPKYEVKWERTTMFTRPVFGTSGTYTFRELWTERFEVLERYLDLKKYIGKKLKDWNNDKRYAPEDINALCDILEDYGHQKTRGDFISYGFKKVGTVKIDVLKSDWYKWRYSGEKEWRELPTVKK